VDWVPLAQDKYMGSCELTNSVALVVERTILSERQPLVSEVSANVCGYRGVA
jgi:hypothetical protein